MLLVVCFLSGDFKESVAYFNLEGIFVGSVLWKSSSKSPPLSALEGFSAVAVGTPNLAFRDFSFYGRPGS
jgi:hypothetical protein